MGYRGDLYHTQLDGGLIKGYDRVWQNNTGGLHINPRCTVPYIFCYESPGSRCRLCCILTSVTPWADFVKWVSMGCRHFFCASLLDGITKVCCLLVECGNSNFVQEEKGRVIFHSEAVMLCFSAL